MILFLKSKTNNVVNFNVSGLVIVVLYFLKKKNLIVLSVKKPESPTVSFENPFYTSNARDTTASNFQVGIISSIISMISLLCKINELCKLLVLSSKDTVASKK